MSHLRSNHEEQGQEKLDGVSIRAAELASLLVAPGCYLKEDLQANTPSLRLGCLKGIKRICLVKENNQ